MTRRHVLAVAVLGPEVHVDGKFPEDRPSTVATRRWRLDRAAQPAHEAR